MALNKIAVPPDPKRDAKARELVPQIKTWHTGTLKQPWGAFERGTAYFITLSGHRCNAVRCSCQDYQSGHICKHVRAVVLSDAQKVTKPHMRYEDLLPVCQQSGCQNDPARRGERYCDVHWLSEAY